MGGLQGWRRIKSIFHASLDFHMQNNDSTNECCVGLNNMNFKSLCTQTVKNRFLESEIIKSGFLLAFVFSLLNSLTSDNHRSPPTSRQAGENLCSVNLELGICSLARWYVASCCSQGRDQRGWLSSPSAPAGSTFGEGGEWEP